MAHDRAAGEHPWTDKGQIILLIVFMIIWVLDSFVFKYSTFLTEYISLYIRLPITGILIIASAYLASKAHVVFHKAPDSPNIVTTGVFKFVRHPMYFGSMLFLKGIPISTLSLYSIAFLFVIFIFYNYISGYEEKILEEKYGKEYAEYKKNIPKWLPNVIGKS